MSESNAVVVGVVEYDAAPSLAKPARGPVVVELVVDGSPSRRFADRSSHIPTPSTYDEFARPRFFAAVTVVSVVVSVIIIVFPISLSLSLSLSLALALARPLSIARPERPPSSLETHVARVFPRLPRRRCDERSSSIRRASFKKSKNRPTDGAPRVGFDVIDRS